MSNLIVNNAYRILGLDNGANQKDILKRYKEIINRLKIDDYPEYDLDLNLDKKLRSEESVNEALKKLQNIKNNVTEYFFWFQIADAIDEDALKFLREKDYIKAIQTWQNASETNNTTSLFYKKNLAILYCLTLLNQQNSLFLKESLSNWHEIVNSDKFWVSFENNYSMINDLALNAEIINDFRKNVTKYISDIYADLYQIYEDPIYVKDFQNLFGVLGEKIEKNLLKPIHQSIYDIIEELNRINQENNEEKVTKTDYKCDNCGDTTAEKYYDYDDGSVLCIICRKNIGRDWKKRVDSLEETVEGSKKKFNRMQKVITKLESQLNQLNEMGLYEDSQSKVVRDHAAEAIRDASVILHNITYMSEKSVELIKLAVRIAGTQGAKEKYESDLNKIQQIVEDDKNTTLVLPIPKLLGKKDLIVKNNFIEYKGKTIYYKDIVKISYHGNTEKFHFTIVSVNDKLNLTFSNQQNLWLELVNVAKQYIEPIITAKLVKSIFEQDQTVQIQDIKIDKRGFHKSRLLKGIDSVLWSDEKIFNPQLYQGNVILYKLKNNISKHFATISLEEWNAAVLPELIKECYNEYLLRNQQG